MTKVTSLIQKCINLASPITDYWLHSSQRCIAFAHLDLDADWDPSKHDTQMAELYGGDDIGEADRYQSCLLD